jgi:hypothetical protein
LGETVGRIKQKFELELFGLKITSLAKTDTGRAFSAPLPHNMLQHSENTGNY